MKIPDFKSDYEAEAFGLTHHKIKEAIESLDQEYKKTHKRLLLVSRALNIARLGKEAIAILFIILVLPMSAHAQGTIDTKRAVIHHTASHDVSAATIDRWHKERGWDGIGYHFVVRANGQIEKGRSLNKKGAHAKGRNNRVGIVLTGYDEFNPLQISALKELLAQIGIRDIERHHEKCPGKSVNIEKMQISLYDQRIKFQRKRK